jgi:hypothetical protein
MDFSSAIGLIAAELSLDSYWLDRPTAAMPV